MQLMPIPMFTGSASPSEVAAAVTGYGCAVLSEAVAGDLLADTVSEYNSIYPPWDDYAARLAAAGESDAGLRADSTVLQLNGPFGKPALDAVPLLPIVQAVVTELLGPATLLQLSHLWVKYGQLAKTFDLPLHSDFLNHTFVYPSDDPRFQVVHGIVYYSDVTLDDGPTYVVPREVSRNEWLLPLFKRRSQLPHLYDNEVPVTVPGGSILLYITKLLHRASVMRDERRRRLTHFFAYGPPDIPWLGWGRWLCSQPGLARQAYIERSGVAALRRCGFPDPSSPYWTQETIEGTSLMYPGFALDAYLRTGSG
jgi:ectoine hydroxylase-related dioxygenase (phytanoyl-CoA dioxygenase family)